MRTLAQWLALQESVHPKSIDMGLGRVTAVARALRLERPRCPVITVGGTNGKGSTVAHLEALLRAAGASTGMFSSPHLVHYNERIRVDGADVEDAALLEAFEQIERARGATTLTFFEYNTLAALWIFAARRVDVAVLEVGLGGRLDATNLVAADVAVVCSIGFDHRDWLGDTLEQIGAEKAGIFRAGRAAVLGTAEVPASVYARIQELGARAIIAGRDFTWDVGDKKAPEEGAGEPVRAREATGGRDDATVKADADLRWSYRGLRLQLPDLPPSALAGSIQYRNAATALAAIEALEGRFALDATTVARGLESVRLAGRFQIVARDAEWILDIAHNEPAARVFAAQVRQRPLPDTRQTYAVLGILADKDAPGIVEPLRSLVDHWILCTLPGPRGRPAGDLVVHAKLPASQVTLAASVQEGCEMAEAAARPGDRVLVFGSVLTVGPALQWLRI